MGELTRRSTPPSPPPEQTWKATSQKEQPHSAQNWELSNTEVLLRHQTDVGRLTVGTKLLRVEDILVSLREACWEERVTCWLWCSAQLLWVTHSIARRWARILLHELKPQMNKEDLLGVVEFWWKRKGRWNKARISFFSQIRECVEGSKTEYFRLGIQRNQGEKNSTNFIFIRIWKADGFNFSPPQTSQMGVQLAQTAFNALSLTLKNHLIRNPFSRHWLLHRPTSYLTFNATAFPQTGVGVFHRSEVTLCSGYQENAPVFAASWLEIKGWASNDV